MRKKKIIAVGLVIFAVLLTSFTFYGYQILYASNILVDAEDRHIYISEDDTFAELQDRFYDEKIVGDLLSFSFIAKLMDYDKLIKPGRYLLRSGMSNLQAIQLLRSGAQDPTSVTFNNIRLIDELGDQITSGIMIDSDEFNKSLDVYIERNQEGFNENNIISMFIPNTYEVYWTISGEELVERMHQEYQKFWSASRIQKAEEIGLSPFEVSTLASIVQAENSQNDEGKRIAGLYMNRLKRGMRLHADPTVVFAVGDFTLKRVLNEHLETDSPYNTYKYGGLPPGPINMPTITNIDAVLNYEDHTYLYMCAREDFSGYHNFATDYSQHLANARKYQRALSIEQRKARENQRGS